MITVHKLSLALGCDVECGCAPFSVANGDKDKGLNTMEMVARIIEWCMKILVELCDLFILQFKSFWNRAS